jgi:hypoxia up-regulated 1
MGSQTFKLGLVSRGKPLEIVTNLHSKRKTETMVLFDQGSRFYGADASSLQTRKPLQTPAMINLLCGRDEAHPAVQDLSTKSYPVPFTFNTTRGGLDVTVKGSGIYTPEELMAMVLSHARAATRAYTSDGKTTLDPLPKDAVLTVPGFYTQREREALKTAAELAGLNVLSLIEENTAAALHYGMDRVVPVGER